MIDRPSIVQKHQTDEAGNPSGGETVAVGLQVTWQNGPLGPNREINGAQVEQLLEAAIGRLQFYQKAKDGKFACRENALAITHLEEALHWLDHRTAARIKRGVEGTHQP